MEWSQTCWSHACHPAVAAGAMIVAAMDMRRWEGWVRSDGTKMDHSSKDLSAVVVVDVAGAVHDAPAWTWQQCCNVHWTEEHRRIGFC